jgi:hypothetical protein
MATFLEADHGGGASFSAPKHRPFIGGLGYQALKYHPKRSRILKEK